MFAIGQKCVEFEDDQAAAVRFQIAEVIGIVDCVEDGTKLLLCHSCRSDQLVICDKTQFAIVDIYDTVDQFRISGMREVKHPIFKLKIYPQSVQLTFYEIIHYYLWVLDYGHNDNDLDFWCMCYAYDGGAYEELTEDDEIYYNIFVSVFDDYVKGLQWNMWHLALGIMINGLHEYSEEEYEERVISEIENMKTRI